MLYKTLYFPENALFDYQFKQGSFYKRANGSKEDWYKVDEAGQKKLAEYFAPQKTNPFWNYNPIALVGGVALLVGAGIFVYKKYMK